MKSIVFEGNTQIEYENIRDKDRAIYKSICKILKEMQRNDPSQGLGKPEPLKHTLSGFWSRRLSQKDRIIYKFDEQYIYIFALGGHYETLLQPE